MKVGWGPLLFWGFTLISERALASHDCGVWIRYFSLQEQVFHLAQRQLPVPPTLRKEMKALEARLNAEVSETSVFLEAADLNLDAVGFEPNVKWTGNEVSDEDTGAAAQAEEERDRESESEYWSFDEKLARLVESLERRGERVNENAIRAIYPRMLATRAFGNQRLRTVMLYAGVDDHSLQVLTLSMWAHNADPRHPSLPDEKELRGYADVMAMPIEAAQEKLRNFSQQPAKMREILEAVAEELSVGVGDAVKMMEAFLRNEKVHQSPTFGRLVYNFLGANDDLFEIHDTESLERYLGRE